MNPHISRLKRRADFVRAARIGRKSVTPGLIVQKVRRSEAEADRVPAAVVRVGFTASRKVGKAVVRNRARRRLRAAAREVLVRHGEAGCDYVIIGRVETVKRPFAALLDDLTTAVCRLKLAGEPSNRVARRRREGRLDEALP